MEVSDEHLAPTTGSVMTPLILITVGALTAWAVDWGQRRCENWCQERDKDV